MISNNEVLSIRSKELSFHTYNTQSPLIKNKSINKMGLTRLSSGIKDEIK